MLLFPSPTHTHTHLTLLCSTLAQRLLCDWDILCVAGIGFFFFWHSRSHWTTGQLEHWLTHPSCFPLFSLQKHSISSFFFFFFFFLTGAWAKGFVCLFICYSLFSFTNKHAVACSSFWIHMYSEENDTRVGWNFTTEDKEKKWKPYTWWRVSGRMFLQQKVMQYLFIR